jgi:hypothetical protein
MPERLTTMATAQETYRTMLREVIAPALRAEGLTGSGQSYELAGERHVGQVTFDRSVHNTKDEVRFRVFLSARPREMARRAVSSPLSDVWHATLTRLIPSRRAFEWWLLRGKDTPQHPPGRIRISTGEQLPQSGQAWASGYYDTADPNAVAADVIEALQQWGLPSLRRELARREE